VEENVLMEHFEEGGKMVKGTREQNHDEKGFFDVVLA